MLFTFIFYYVSYNYCVFLFTFDFMHFKLIIEYTAFINGVSVLDQSIFKNNNLNLRSSSFKRNLFDLSIMTASCFSLKK